MASILDNPVDRQILEELAAKNQKHIERADESYKDLGTIKIFNIGPIPHVISLGGLGMFTVPACPEGRVYSEPLEIWKMTPEGQNVDMNKIAERLVNGWGIAEAIVGYGKFMHKSSDMRRIGIFTCGGFVTIRAKGKPDEKILASDEKPYLKVNAGAKIVNVRQVTQLAIDAARKHGDERTDAEISADIMAANLPTEAELDAATAQLHEYCNGLVAEADDHYRNNDLKEIQAMHRWAGRYTNNTDRPWVKMSIIMLKCSICGNALLPDVAICLGCKSVVPGKEEIVKARRVPGYEWIWNVPAEQPETEPEKKTGGKGKQPSA